MKRYFFCYNRDELSRYSVNGKTLPELIQNKMKEDASWRDNTYFDNMDLKKTDPEIWKAISDYISKPDVTMFYISKTSMVFGWAERELVEAIKKGAPIVLVLPETLIKAMKRGWSLEDLCNSSIPVFPKYKPLPFRFLSSTRSTLSRWRLHLKGREDKTK